MTEIHREPETQLNHPLQNLPKQMEIPVNPSPKRPSSTTFNSPTPKRRKETFSAKPNKDDPDIEVEIKSETEAESVPNKIVFECVDCRKTYLHRKSFQAHQKKSGHGAKCRSVTPSSKSSTPKAQNKNTPSTTPVAPSITPP